MFRFSLGLVSRKLASIIFDLDRYHGSEGVWLTDNILTQLKYHATHLFREEKIQEGIHLFIRYTSIEIQLKKSCALGKEIRSYLIFFLQIVTPNKFLKHIK